MTTNNAAPAKAPDILLAAINAKWIHPSLALRLLKANLGPLADRCEIIEFALRQPLAEQIAPILAARPRILGLSVSIWNHRATLELLKALRQTGDAAARPVIVLGGPEVSFLPPDAEIFRYADYCVRGEGEAAFRSLCAELVNNGSRKRMSQAAGVVFVNPDFQPVNTETIRSAYRLYTDEDLRKKLIYVEAGRGCPCSCEFCLSAARPGAAAGVAPVREFPLEPFLAEMDALIRRGARTIKFLDRTFNLNITRARRIMEFFLERLNAVDGTNAAPFTVHFEMIPSRFPPELRETLARFPPGSLRLEIGIQTLNSEAAARVGRAADPAAELETLRLLRETTNAVIHADLIAGLPGEDLASFGRGFDRLWAALSAPAHAGTPSGAGAVEIQLGILKLLPGAPIARHSAAAGMRYNPAPPYEVIETAALSAGDLARIGNFARFWELIVNRSLLPLDDMAGQPVFDRFMALSDSLLARFGRNWGIDKNELRAALIELVFHY
jgi:radical SAM superfamily enzyme YgiQ (UPF0313 family)